MLSNTMGVPARLSVFFTFTAVFFFVLSGLFTPNIALQALVAAMILVHIFRFEQLPLTRLHKFDAVFGLTIAPENETQPAKSDSKELPLHRVILHRGGCVSTPENTLEAIRQAANDGVAGVEIDLQFTADGVGILLHDDTLERTTDATGDVRRLTYSEIKYIDAAAKHKNREHFSGPVKIPTLEECLTECLRLNLLVFIDCKAFARKTADLIHELFTKYPELYDVAAVCSFYPEIIYTVRRKNPRAITALTYRKMALSCDSDCVTPRFKGLKHYMLTLLDYVNMWISYAWTWYLCGNSFLLLNKESLCMNEVHFWKNLGIHLLPWTVNWDVEKQHCLQYLQLPIITDGL